MSVKHPIVLTLLAVTSALSVSATALAESLEQRVQALEKTQDQQDSAIQMISDLASKVDVSGFISIRGGQIDSEEMSYLGVMDDKWTFSKESVIGLQVDSRVSDELSVSLQLKAGGLSDGVELEWGYLEYAFEPDLKMRAGRLRAPGFMLSEYLDVGYAYPWAQVPFEVYGWLPFNRYEGLDLRKWISVGDADIRLSTYAGTSTGEKLRIGNFQYSDQDSRFAGLDVQVTYDIFTARAGYSKYRFDVSNSVLDSFLDPLVYGVTVVPGVPGYVDEVRVPGMTDFVQNVIVGDGVTPSSGVLTDVILGIQNDGIPGNDFLIPVLQAEGASLIAQLEPYQNIPTMNGEREGEFYGAGFSLDNGTFLLMSEISISAIEGVFPDVESGYIMLGYRIGNWMPHFTFAKMYTVNDDEWPDLELLQGNPAVSAIVPGYDQLLAGANTYSNVLITTRNAMRMEQESYTLGLRWDPMPGVDVKMETFLSKNKGDSYGFALPSALLTLGSSNGSELSSQSLELPSAEDQVVGVRVALDMVF